MKYKWLWALLLVLALLTGCSKSEEAPAEDGKGDVITEEAAADANQEATEDTQEEPLVTAEDFYGTWEYEEYYSWLCVYGDGTYEWYTEEGLTNQNTYHMDGVELYLDDSDLFFAVDGEGGMIDSEGDRLFLSELPDFEALLAEPLTIGDYCGTWEYSDRDVWLTVYDNGTYDLIWYDGALEEGGCHVEGDTLWLVDGTMFVLDPGGWLTDEEGVELYASERPDPDALYEAYYGPAVSAEEFYGTWEYAYYFYWLVVHADGTYDWYTSTGWDHAGTWYLEGVELYLDEGDLWFALDGEGGLIDNDGDALYASELPFGDPGDADLENPFLGCWETYGEYIWLYVYDDGTYEWYGDFVGEPHGTYTLEDDTMYLDTGDYYVFDDFGDIVDQYGNDLYSSELPEDY